MPWCNNNDSYEEGIARDGGGSGGGGLMALVGGKLSRTCPACGQPVRPARQVAAAGATTIQELPGLPAGVKFDPTDQELLEHLEGKARPEVQQGHPLIDEFIPSIEGETGICYTHPEKLPGVSKDGQVRHFFHRPSKAYTTGTRKRRKVRTDDDRVGAGAGETRWHKTGKTRPIYSGSSTTGKLLGYKKILVLYTNYGKLRKPEKTNWVMHQYHLGADEEERDGELVVSKVFFQTQPRQCAGSAGYGKEPVDAAVAGRVPEEDIYSMPMLMSYSSQGSGGVAGGGNPQMVNSFGSMLYTGGTSFSQI